MLNIGQGSMKNFVNIKQKKKSKKRINFSTIQKPKEILNNKTVLKQLFIID